MDTGGDRGERDENAVGGGSGISRRHFVAGGLFAIGGTSQLMTRQTKSEFTSSATASGSVGIGYVRWKVHDYSASNNGPTYEIEYDVTLGDSFESVEIIVENLDDGGEETRFPDRPKSDVVTYSNDWGSNFEFTLNAFIADRPQPVFSRSLIDEPDGENPDQNDDMSDPDDPVVDWIIVDDTSDSWNGAIYDVYYSVSNTDNFSEVDVKFDSASGNWASKTIPNSASTGSVEYSEDNHGAASEITVSAKDDDGIVVDDATVEDVADGDDPPAFGDPSLPDSPTLDSFTVSDNSTNTVEFEVDFLVSNTERLARVDVIYQNISDNSPSKRVTDVSSPVTITDGQNTDERYAISIEVWELRDDVAFPIDSGTIEDEADGMGNESYP